MCWLVQRLQSWQILAILASQTNREDRNIRLQRSTFGKQSAVSAVHRELGHGAPDDRSAANVDPQLNQSDARWTEGSESLAN
jgi:hypothetical protein